jgi:hypothetical protein
MDRRFGGIHPATYTERRLKTPDSPITFFLGTVFITGIFGRFAHPHIRVASREYQSLVLLNHSAGDVSHGCV